MVFIQRKIHSLDVEITPTTVPAIKRNLVNMWINDAKRSTNSVFARYAPLCIYDGMKNLFAPTELNLDPKRSHTFTIDFQSQDSGTYGIPFLILAHKDSGSHSGKLPISICIVSHTI
jgi:hypothetical protein